MGFVQRDALSRRQHRFESGRDANFSNWLMTYCFLRPTNFLQRRRWTVPDSSVLKSHTDAMYLAYSG
jgi:hypothetical protein